MKQQIFLLGLIIINLFNLDETPVAPYRHYHRGEVVRSQNISLAQE